MRVIIKDFDTKENILEFSTKNVETRDIIKEVSIMQQKEDVLLLGAPGNIIRTPNSFGLGIKNIYTSGSKCCSRNIFKNTSSVDMGDGTYLLSANIKDDEEPEFISYFENENGKEVMTSKRIILIIFREGYVLNIGKKSYSIFGTSADSYFKKFTSTKFMGSTESDAKTFDKPKDLLKYVKANEEKFKYVIQNYGYSLKIDYINDLFEKEVEKSGNKENVEKEFEEINKYFQKLNCIEPEETETEPIPDKIDEDALKIEVYKRMKSLDLIKDVWENFNKSILMMSEGAGILYFLDDLAKKAVEEAKEEGYFPYHVIHSNTEFGEIYDVLCVSDESAYWNEERFNKRDGAIWSYCFNNTCPEFSEAGTIIVTPANGGVKRIV